MSERLGALARVEGGQLMAELLQGAVAVYFDRRYEREQLEAALSEQLEALRQRYPRQSLKSLEGHFQDLLRLVSHCEGKKRAELQQVLSRDCGVPSGALQGVLESLEAVLQTTAGQSAASQLLKKVHYSQLINFDFKFASKPL